MGEGAVRGYTLSPAARELSQRESQVRGRRLREGTETLPYNNGGSQFSPYCVPQIG